MAGRHDVVSIHIGSGPLFAVAERALLLGLQRRALRYFLDGQGPLGLVFDRRDNRGRPRPAGMCSTSATGMGLIALALASAPPYRLVSRGEAIRRVGAALEAAWRLPHHEGILPHFVDPATGEPLGHDVASTIDTAWLLAGALWSASFLDDARLQDLAGRLFDRVDWRYWSAPEESGSSTLIRHGQGRDGRLLDARWDRLNGETVFLYVLAAGAEWERALPGSAWTALRPFYGCVGGQQFNNADLGLFVFQYGLDLLDLRRWRPPCGVDLAGEAAVAATANRGACREAASDFVTFRTYWGLSAGDGPGDPPEPHAYRAYSPSGPIDGTAHLTATLASVAHQPEAAFANVHAACRDRKFAPLGRYGFGNVNIDRGWVARDMVGIDAGAAVLALDNALADDRVRTIFHALPCVRLGLARLGFADVTSGRRAS
jgi:hypothetical protein